MDGIPVKIVYKDQIKRRCHCNDFGYGTIKNETGKVVQVIKFNPKTGEKRITFEDKKEMKRMREKLKKEKLEKGVI